MNACNISFSDSIPKSVLNRALRIGGDIYRTTGDVQAAMNGALQHMHEEVPDGFDEQEARITMQQAILGGVFTIPPKPAPGTDSQESKGRFTGLVTKDSDRQWREQATDWVEQFGEDMQTAFEKAMSPAVNIDPALRQYVLTELLERTEAVIRKPANQISMMAALNLQKRVADGLRDSGAHEFGKVGAARALSFNRIDWMMPVLTFRGLVRDAQAKLPFPEVTSDAIRRWLTKAGRKAVAEMKAAMKKADNVVARELKREVREMGATWRKIFESAWAVQGDFRMRLYAAVMSHPDLTGLSPEAATELVNLLADEWERQRMRIFRVEFNKEVQLPGVRDVDLKKLHEALPDIVIQSNVGLLDNEAFRNAIAPKFGVATFDGPTAEIVDRLAQEAQAAPFGVVRSRLIAKMVDAIRSAGGVRKLDVFRDYWYAAMLSGIRTQVDNGLSILNGALNTAFAMAAKPGSSALIGGAYMRGLAEAARDFVPILKGERWRMANVDIDRPASALEALRTSQNAVARIISHGAFVSRLIGALDHLNALSSREAMKAWAMANIGMESAIVPTAEDIDNARERAIMEGTPKALLEKRVREILEERIPTEILLASTEIGRQVSFQNVPYGMLGHFYKFILSLENIPHVGGFARILSGTAFARYALNYTNDILNYVAPIGLYRLYASAPERAAQSGLDMTPEMRQLLLAKVIFGTLAATVAAAVFLGDDDDERKRAIDITGSFRSLDPDKKRQLLSEGRQPYSIRIGETYYSYRQLPVAGILGSVGEMRDRQLFDAERFNQDSVAEKLANGGLAGLFIVRDSSAIVGLMDMLGAAQAYKYDTEAILTKSIPKWLGRTAGSLIPNIAKEIDAWSDPGIYQGNAGWEFFMQHVPWVRRDVPPGPAINVFGEKVEVERLPWSRWVRNRKTSIEWTILGDLASKGVFLPVPGPFTIDGDDGTRTKATNEQRREYAIQVGAEYKEYIKDQGQDLLNMPPAEARKKIDKDTTAIRRRVRAQL